jgi:hypothetical protein
MPARELVANPAAFLESLGEPNRVFVRPDSALKPFAGRVVATTQLTLAALDFGFYYDDPDLPVVVAPVRQIGREWRHVIVDRTVVAGSEYVAAGRQARPSQERGAAWELAAGIASSLDPPEAVYVMDVCEVDGDLRLLELNPFSGADLYACDAGEVVAAVSGAAMTAWSRAQRAT